MWDTGAPSIQSHQESLYARVAGAVGLLGKDVLEVGCGRGGGAAAVVRRFGPRSLVGLDLSNEAVVFCRARHRLDGLSFVQGDAEDLPFQDGSFDVVLNVESSHGYASPSRFLAGVVRVLRPGGFLLLADMRPRTLSETLRDQFRDAGLVIVEEELINEGVVRALEMDSEWKLARILARVPRFLHRVMRQFAAIPGTPVFEGLRSGEIEYLRFVLRKPDHGGSSSSHLHTETPGESS